MDRLLSNENEMEINFNDDFFSILTNRFFFHNEWIRIQLKHDDVNEKRKKQTFLFLSPFSFRRRFNYLDHIETIDEIRIGYQTLTFDELVQEKILSSDEVNRMKRINEKENLFSFRNRPHFRFFIIIIETNFI